MDSLNRTADRDTLARLRWQCRRGMLELDLLLQPFVEHHYAELSEDEQVVFRELLKYSDQELQEILLGFKVPDNKDVANVTDQIRKATTA